MKIKLLYNPLSGTRKIRERFFRAVNSFAQHGIEVDLHTITQKFDESRRIARETARTGDHDLLVVAGGDGTINQVVHGIVEAGSQIPMGIIPVGTANILAYELGMPCDPFQACNGIIRGGTKKIDVLKAGDRYGVMMVGIGFDAHVVHTLDLGLKRSIGRYAYVAAGIKALLNYNPDGLDIRLDNGPAKLHGYFAIITNARHYAGGYMLAPSVRVDDGYMDICLVTDRRVRTLLKVFSNLFLHKGIVVPGVLHTCARSIEVYTERPVPVQIDGDPAGETPLRCEVLHQALSLVGTGQ